MCFLIGSAKMTSTSQLVYCRRQVATKIRSVNGNLRFAAAPTVLGISLGGTAVLKGLAEGGVWPVWVGGSDEKSGGWRGPILVRQSLAKALMLQRRPSLVPRK